MFDLIHSCAGCDIEQIAALAQLGGWGGGFRNELGARNGGYGFRALGAWTLKLLEVT